MGDENNEELEYEGIEVESQEEYISHEAMIGDPSWLIAANYSEERDPLSYDFHRIKCSSEDVDLLSCDTKGGNSFLSKIPFLDGGKILRRCLPTYDRDGYNAKTVNYAVHRKNVRVEIIIDEFQKNCEVGYKWFLPDFDLAPYLYGSIPVCVLGYKIEYNTNEDWRSYPIVVSSCYLSPLINSEEDKTRKGLNIALTCIRKPTNSSSGAIPNEILYVPFTARFHVNVELLCFSNTKYYKEIDKVYG